jgi:hypothetical protein
MANDRELPVGKHRRTSVARHWRRDLAEHQATSKAHIE